MFASPSPKNYLLSKNSSLGALEKSISPNKSDQSRKKIQEKIIRNYMTKYNMAHPDEKITQEVKQFFQKSDLTFYDLKSLDINVANIVASKKSSNDSNNANNIETISVSKSNQINGSNKQNPDVVKLPTILSNNSRRRDQMAESRASGMSGGSELSQKYNGPNLKKQQLELLLKEYAERKEQIADLKDEKKEENLRTQENKKRENQNLRKKDLDSQVIEKKIKKEELSKLSKEFDSKIMKSIGNSIEKENEREDKKRRQIEEKRALDEIMKEKKKRIAIKEKRERELEDEASIIIANLVKTIIEAIKADEKKEKEKRQRKKENSVDLLQEIEDKKRREKEILENEREYEKLCLEDNEKINEKRDYLKYMELTNKGMNPNPKYDNLKNDNIKEGSIGQKTKSVITNEVTSENRQDDEETLLKKIQEINFKKYDELEQKIKELEDKLEVKNREENSNTKKVKINRYPNSFIGQTNNIVPLKRKPQDLKRTERNNMANSITNNVNTVNNGLVINKIKDSVLKAKQISSSLFTTQIGN